MKFNIDKIDLENYNPNKPIFYNNYLFHYLIMLDKLDILKIKKHPIFHFNEENLDGFMLAAKYNNFKILEYLLQEYPQYCQNHNEEGLNFINYTSPKKLIQLMKKFTKIDWNYLLKFKNETNIEYYKYILSELDKEDILFFIDKFKFPNYYTLNAILYNEKITDSDKIIIFNRFDNINDKNYENQGLLIDLINSENIKLLKYFINRNLDLEYIIKPSTLFITPFFYLIVKLFTDRKNNKLEKILEIIWEKIKINYSYTNKDGINYVQLVLKYNYETSSKSDIVKKIIKDILKNSPDDSWNLVNLNKETSLFYLINYPVKEYSQYIKGRKLDINYKNKLGETVVDLADEKWKQVLNKMTNYTPKLDIELDVRKYQHQTKFTATMIDIIIYFVYLSKKYKNLYIPYINDPNNNREEFSWVIKYSKDNIDIHHDLNKVINTIRRENTHDYALLFISVDLENDLKHANILLYDFKNLTIERFEPYGNDDIESELDDILDEELTWNTGFKYLKPSDFLPKPGYQLLSNENDSSQQKVGDFGGFCLGWCIWYVEHRIKNSKIDPKTLNSKTLEKLLRMDDSLTEFIRNYSNKLFDEKFKIVKNICPNGECIDEKAISNIYLNSNDINKIFDYVKQYFGSI